MTLLGLAMLVAGAAPLELRTSSEARVVVMPRGDPHLAEIGLYGNRTWLRSTVAAWRAPGLDHARLVEVGGGIAFVELALEDPRLTPVLVAGAEAGTWTVRLDRLSEPAPIALETPTLADVLADPPRRPADPVDLSLTPLLGDGRSYGLAPSTVRLQVPADEPAPSEGFEEMLGPVVHPTWEDVDRWRQLVVELENPEDVAIALRRLAEAHATLGFPREAAYYFREAAETGTPTPGLWLGRADVALTVRDWATARDACARAADLGGPEEEILVCFAILSQATGSPAPAVVGRALGAVATRRTARFLAGDLLLRDGYAEEALPLLEAAAEELRGEAREVSWLAAGDAALLTGDTDRARHAYQSARHGKLDDLLRVREDLVGMLHDGVRRWPAWVPQLTAHADADGPAAPDALYLLAQVHHVYEDPESESEALGQLWDIHPRGRQGSDVGRRLTAACGARVSQLAHQERDADTVTTWERCWRPGLEAWVQDTDPMLEVSRAWERLGLADRALGIQSDLTSVLAGQGREEAEPVIRLARLQVKVGVPDRAVDTLAYASRLPDAAEPAVVASLARAWADVDLARDDWQAAVGHLAEAAEDDELRAEAERRSMLLRIDHEVCDVARPLANVLAAGPLDDEPAGHVELRVAACLIREQDPERALRVLGWAVERSDDPRVQQEARWLASAVAERTDTRVPDEVRSPSVTFAMLDEEASDDAAWTARLKAWMLSVP